MFQHYFALCTSTDGEYLAGFRPLGFHEHEDLEEVMSPQDIVAVPEYQLKAIVELVEGAESGQDYFLLEVSDGRKYKETRIRVCYIGKYDAREHALKGAQEYTQYQHSLVWKVYDRQTILSLLTEGRGKKLN